MPLSLSSTIREYKEEFYQKIFNDLPAIHLLPLETRDQALTEFIQKTKADLERARGKKNLAFAKLSKDEEVILGKIISIKSEIDIINSKNPEQKEEDLERLIKSEIVPLIHQIFSPLKARHAQKELVISENEYNKLIKCFTDYRYRKDTKFLTLYLQFLTRCQFFSSNREDKLSLFCGFHSIIEECLGGMITRLEDYIGSGLRQKISQGIFTKMCETSTIAEDTDRQIHASAFIKKYIIGVGSGDSNAIDVAQLLPSFVREEICQKALTGDFLEELLFLELKNFIRKVLEMDEQEFNETMLNEVGHCDFYLEKDHYIDSIRSCAQIISQAISSEQEIDSDAGAIVPLAIFQQDIIFENYKVRNFQERKAAIKKIMHEQKFDSIDELCEHYARISIEGARAAIARKEKEARETILERKEALNQQAESIEEELRKKDEHSPEAEELQTKINEIRETSKITKVKRALISDEIKAKLAKLGTLYSILLDPRSPALICEEDFIEYCNELFTFERVEVEGLEASKTAYSMKLSAELVEELAVDQVEYINRKISALAIVKHSEQVEDKGEVLLFGQDKSLENFVKTIKEYQRIAQNPALLDKSQWIRISMPALYALNKYYKKRGLKDLEYLEFWERFCITTADEGDLSFEAMHIPAKEFWIFIENCKFVSRNHSDQFAMVSQDFFNQNQNFYNNFVATALRDINQVNDLANTEPKMLSFLLLKSQIPSDVAFVLSSKAGEIFAKKKIDLFCKVFSKLDDRDDIIKVLKSRAGKVLAEKSPKIFVLQLSKALKRFPLLTIDGRRIAENNEAATNILKSNVGERLAEIDVESFVKIISWLDADSISAIFSSHAGFIFAKHHPDKFAKKCSNFNDDELVRVLTNSRAGAELVENGTKYFSQLVLNIDRVENILNLLKSDVAKDFAYLDPASFFKILLKLNAMQTIMAEVLDDNPAKIMIKNIFAIEGERENLKIEIGERNIKISGFEQDDIRHLQANKSFSKNIKITSDNSLEIDIKTFQKIVDKKSKDMASERRALLKQNPSAKFSLSSASRLEEQRSQSLSAGASAAE